MPVVFEEMQVLKCLDQLAFVLTPGCSLVGQCSDVATFVIYTWIWPSSANCLCIMNISWSTCNTFNHYQWYSNDLLKLKTHAFLSVEIERIQKGESKKEAERETYLDLFTTKNIKVKERVLIPVKQYPRVSKVFLVSIESWSFYFFPQSLT